MEQVRFFGIVVAFCLVSTVLGCGGSDTKKQPTGGDAVPKSSRTAAPHETGMQCVLAAQRFADAKEYAEAIETLRECESKYGVTVEYLPVFPDQNE